ncbi:hypothetical protein GALMADRAFT_1122404 [Galerina marginata CBS 339.88]|uniref:F-box domain-containing protein n=1 Tax=Galerina marginata (strain CBS 339.88) TaxID=685588 RepID=A0A067TMF6_GALM3|nr:hypothetical protein GALMADRAFT_1122404 [Galerina marginata CBS 339.88]
MENEDTWQRLFEHHESSLEILKMKFPSPSLIDNPRSSIFFASSITPVLQTLSVEYAGLDFSTLRMPSLRNLVIGSPVSVPALLSALRHMPLLEVLQASTLELKPLPGDVDTRSVLPKATLPRLRTLEFHDIDNCIDFVLSFLAQITPAVGCMLDFSGAYYDEAADFNQASSVLSAYLQNYTASSAVTKVDMKLVVRQVIFRLDNSSSGRFSFGLESDFAEEGIAAHFSALSTIEVGAIKTLTLSLTRSNACHPNFRNFVFSLVSVEHLKTDLQTLDYFQNILLSPGIIALPALKTIYVDCHWESHYLMIVVSCINRRIELGVRPEKLTLKFENSTEIAYARVELDLLFPGELIVRYIT